ncbi:MAG: hypothetical protein RLY16_684 [Bacteroidota bacterium]|jgi:hypothetical protein
MNKFFLLVIVVIYSNRIAAQSIDLGKTQLIPFQVYMQLDSNGVVRAIKDSTIIGVDEPTFVRIKDFDFSNGIIELKVLSKLTPRAGDTARGFIGIAFRINENNSAFESIYLRPTNGRAMQQIRRNRAIQYFSYPNYKYNILRQTSPGQYESYADMGLNEWIQMKIVVNKQQAILYLNNNSQPALIVNDLKLGPDQKGGIGLFVDIGTEGYFKDLKITKTN